MDLGRFPRIIGVSSVTGEVGDRRERLIAFLDMQNIKLEFNEKIAPALGVSYGGRIALLPGQSKAEEFTTLVHKTAHELLHKTERRTMTTATVRKSDLSLQIHPYFVELVWSAPTIMPRLTEEE